MRRRDSVCSVEIEGASEYSSSRHFPPFLVKRTLVIYLLAVFSVHFSFHEQLPQRIIYDAHISNDSCFRPDETGAMATIVPTVSHMTILTSLTVDNLI